jgi:hypothetical protein
VVTSMTTSRVPSLPKHLHRPVSLPWPRHSRSSHHCTPKRSPRASAGEAVARSSVAHLSHSTRSRNHLSAPSECHDDTHLTSLHQRKSIANTPSRVAVLTLPAVIHELVSTSSRRARVVVALPPLTWLSGLYCRIPPTTGWLTSILMPCAQSI